VELAAEDILFLWYGDSHITIFFLMKNCLKLFKKGKNYYLNKTYKKRWNCRTFSKKSAGTDY